MSLLLVATMILACNSEPVAPPAPPVTAAPATQPLPSGVPDPAEAGISELAKLARHIFGVMESPKVDCIAVNPASHDLRYTIETVIAGNQITSVDLVEVAAVHRSGPPETLEPNRWPTALSLFVGCLGPHLLALDLSAAPVAEGTYRSVYVWPALGAQ